MQKTFVFDVWQGPEYPYEVAFKDISFLNQYE